MTVPCSVSLPQNLEQATVQRWRSDSRIVVVDSRNFSGAPPRRSGSWPAIPEVFPGDEGAGSDLCAGKRRQPMVPDNHPRSCRRAARKLGRRLQATLYFAGAQSALGSRHFSHSLNVLQTGAHTMVLFFRALTLGAVALALVLGATSGAVVAQRRGEPGRFDYYLLSLSWTPSFCASATGVAREEECGRPLSFVVHGLWPQYERGFPENCQQPPPRLSRRIVSDMLDLMPGAKLVYHEWDTHGTCSGLDQRDYFDLVRKARDAVTIPPAFDDPRKALTIAPNDIVAAFVSANPGLSPDGVMLECEGARLREVHICLTRHLAFRSCRARNQKSCRRDSLMMPPVGNQ
jgi:ribonuclease T2